jgi:DNA-binding IclR family transcriptional regulator
MQAVWPCWWVSARAGSSGVMAPRVGAGIAAYCTGVGKVLLAWQSPEQIEEYLLNETLIPITHNTITDPDLFRKELAQIREQGFALDRGEALVETGCVAAPYLVPISNRGCPKCIGSCQGHIK